MRRAWQKKRDQAIKTNKGIGSKGGGRGHSAINKDGGCMDKKGGDEESWVAETNNGQHYDKVCYPTQNLPVKQCRLLLKSLHGSDMRLQQQGCHTLQLHTVPDQAPCPLCHCGWCYGGSDSKDNKSGLLQAGTHCYVGNRTEQLRKLG
jgi:hypothetical protein